MDCRYNKYSLQLCFYKYLLFCEFGISVQGEYIVHLKDYSVDIHEAADFYSIAEKISNGRREL